jgi:glutathione S-transferase
LEVPPPVKRVSSGTERSSFTRRCTETTPERHVARIRGIAALRDQVACPGGRIETCSPRKEIAMKLYFAPGTCSLSPHIVLNELKLPYTAVRVDTKTRKIADGGDYRAVNPKGYVPAIELDNGQRLTEGPAIVQYLADLKPESKLAPANGTFARARLQEWLNFIATELHKTYSPLFNASMPAEATAIFKDKLVQRYEFIAQALGKQDYLLGDHFTIADAYLYTVTRWAKHFDVDVNRWPALAKYMERVGARAAVKAAVEAESTAKKAA